MIETTHKLKCDQSGCDKSITVVGKTRLDLKKQALKEGWAWTGANKQRCASHKPAGKVKKVAKPVKKAVSKKVKPVSKTQRKNVLDYSPKPEVEVVEDTSSNES